MTRYRKSAIGRSPDRMTMDMGHDIIRLAADQEGIEAWKERHGTPYAFAFDLYGEDDDEEFGRLLATAMLCEQDRQARRRAEETRQAGLFLEKPDDSLMYPPEDPRRKCT